MINFSLSRSLRVEGSVGGERKVFGGGRRGMGKRDEIYTKVNSDKQCPSGSEDRTWHSTLDDLILFHHGRETKVYYKTREREKFIIRQPPMGEKDDYDSENSWISDGLPSSSRRRRRGDGRGEGESGERSKMQARSSLTSTATKARSRSREVATLDDAGRRTKFAPVKSLESSEFSSEFSDLETL